jgi:hypothetical protein
VRSTLVLDRYGRCGARREISYVMRYLNAERAGRDVYLSSDRWRSVHSGWHKMWGLVKGSLKMGRQATSRGRDRAAWGLFGGKKKAEPLTPPDL